MDITFGKHCKAARGTRPLREVASEIGISPATLHRIESGKQPDITSYQKTALWLQRQPTQLLNQHTELTYLLLLVQRSMPTAESNVSLD